MFNRILFLLIIITTGNANAECNFISANYIKELSDPSYITEIKIDVNNKKKYVINYLKILNYKNFSIPQKFKKNLRHRFK